MARTTIHLMRHGEVHNPECVLYGRLPGYHLSNLGSRMAQQVADVLAASGHDLTHVITSPLERARETGAPPQPEPRGPRAHRRGRGRDREGGCLR